MPTYEYECEACEHRVEIFQSIKDAPKRKCPACGKVWHHTQCLVCARWSRHMDWYHFEPPTEVERTEFSSAEFGV